MQDNDLPQIGTPMQTDETRASIGRHLATFNLFREADHSLQITIAEAKGVQAELGGSGAPLALCAMNALYSAVDSRRGKPAFAAPPAVEREEGQPTLADIEHRSLRLQGESANAHGLTFGEPVSEWIAGRMKDAADRALAPSTPTLHPSDREAIAPPAVRASPNEVDRQWAAFAGASMWNPLYAKELAESVLRGGRDDTDLVQAFAQHRLAILALSGPLAPEGGEHPLARMVALDEEIEAEHPGWMTGIATEKGETK